MIMELREEFKREYPDTRYFDGPEYIEWLEKRIVAQKLVTAIEGTESAELRAELSRLKSGREKELKEAWLDGWEYNYFSRGTNAIEGCNDFLRCKEEGRITK
jgi:hypothetical protein